MGDGISLKAKSPGGLIGQAGGEIAGRRRSLNALGDDESPSREHGAHEQGNGQARTDRQQEHDAYPQGAALNS